jgi:pimeloyl-ACP methyl ester carboxylesterase
MLYTLIFRSFLVVVAILLAFAVILFFVQDGMIYFPRPYTAMEVKNWKAEGMLQLDYETGQGNQGAFYQAPENGAEAARIWLVFGGNGGRAVDYRQLARDKTCGYLFVDYPGYGLCAGRPNPQRIDDSVDGAIAALEKEMGMDGEVMRGRLCVVGHSLGAAVGLRAAVRYQIGQVVLLAPFTTMKAMAAQVVGGLYSNVVRHRFDNLAELQALKDGNPGARVTILGGTDDREIPPAMGRELAERFAGMVEHRPLDGVGHNNILDEELPAVLEAMGEAR